MMELLHRIAIDDIDRCESTTYCDITFNSLDDEFQDNYISQEPTCDKCIKAIKKSK